MLSIFVLLLNYFIIYIKHHLFTIACHKIIISLRYNFFTTIRNRLNGAFINNNTHKLHLKEAKVEVIN